jgi:hypothetical protein
MTVYLNTYEVWQAYGGPEEGGWWYDCGAPVQSVLISDQDLEEFLENSDSEELAKMRNGATLAYTQGRAPTAMKTGYGGYVFLPDCDEPISYHQDNDFRSCFEDCFAEAFPQERPCYC